MEDHKDDKTDMTSEQYAHDWAMTFSKTETHPVFIPDPTVKGGLKRVYVPAGTYEMIKRVTESPNRLEALERVMQLKENEREGKTYGAKPVPTVPHSDRYKIHEEFQGFAMDVFRAAGYTVTKLYQSPFDFVAQRKGKGGDEDRTYYVLAKCGKLTRRANLSQRQLLRMKEQYLNPRFGTQNVVKLYWYACTTDNSHRTYLVGVHGGYGLKPIPHPLPEFTALTPPVVHKKGRYACKLAF